MSPENRQYKNLPSREEQITDPVVATRDFYSEIYLRFKQDSPDSSRTSLTRRAKHLLSQLTEEESVLDLGAGRQIFEREYARSYGKPTCQIVTFDIAKLRKRQLLTSSFRASHIRGNGERLPFKNESFSLVLSNMALDFMPEIAIDELYRVVKPNGHVFINLHHPDLIPENLDELLNNKKLKKQERSVYEFWKFLRDNDKLLQDPDEIRTKFFSRGFRIIRLNEATDNRDKWWEVDLVKIPLPEWNCGYTPGVEDTARSRIFSWIL